MTFPHIRRLLYKFDKEEVIVTPCHGDLNTNNIFLSNKKSSIALIDFEYSCPDMVFKDFISLETSIRAYHNENSCTLGDLVKLELQCIKSKSVDGEYFGNINKIREASKKLSNNLNLANKFSLYNYDKLYYIGLLFHLFKLLGLSIWEGSQIKRLLAAYIATAIYLDEIS